jgi:hypothetical protein
VCGNALSLNLHQQDEELLHKFKNDIQCEHPIKSSKVVYRRIHIYSKTLIESLLVHGIGERKSLTLQFPKIPDELVNHFIRGYFDGDGCITFYKKLNYAPCPNVTIIGTYNFNEILQTYFYKYADVKITKLVKHPSNNLCYAMWCGAGNAIKIREWLYKDATIWLQRKRDKFYSVIAIRGAYKHHT